MASWGGIDWLSVKIPGAMTDYDRACEGVSKALTAAPLQNGEALFFQGPFDTSFWQRSRDGKLFVVRIEACEPDADFTEIMESFDENIFDNPVESLSFRFACGDLVVFDSAENGAEVRKKIRSYRINPGTYNILSQFLEKKDYSLLLHRFDSQT